MGKDFFLGLLKFHVLGLGDTDVCTMLLSILETIKLYNLFLM